MAMYIVRKWNRVTKYFYFHTTIMMWFLFFFSFFVVGLFFSTHKSECYTATGNTTNNEAGYPTLFHGCEDSFQNGYLLCEIGLCFTTVLFLLVEVFQMTSRGGGYWKNFENWIQLIIIICSIVAMATKHVLLRKRDTDAEIFRSVVALGLLASFFEVILIVGRYPFRGSDFSIMFYKVLKKISIYTVALVVVIMGFSCSFTILQYGTCSEGDGDNECSGESGFASSWKAFVRTLTIALGEFNFEDSIYSRFNDSQQYVSRAVSLMILVIMIFTVTITLVNLFIAVIINDRRDMKISVFKENLIYMAENIKLAETILPECLKTKLDEAMLEEEKIDVCIHELCGPSCKAKKIPSSAKLIEEPLINIIKKQMKEKFDTRMSIMDKAGRDRSVLLRADTNL